MIKLPPNIHFSETIKDATTRPKIYHLFSENLAQQTQQVQQEILQAISKLFCWTFNQGSDYGQFLISQINPSHIESAESILGPNPTLEQMENFEPPNSPLQLTRMHVLKTVTKVFQQRYFNNPEGAQLNLAIQPTTGELISCFAIYHAPLKNVLCELYDLFQYTENPPTPDQTKLNQFVTAFEPNYRHLNKTYCNGKLPQDYAEACKTTFGSANYLATHPKFSGKGLALGTLNGITIIPGSHNKIYLAEMNEDSQIYHACVGTTYRIGQFTEPQSLMVDTKFTMPPNPNSVLAVPMAKSVPVYREMCKK